MGWATVAEVIAIVVVLIGMFGGILGAKAFGKPKYTAYGRVLVLNLDNNDPRFGVQITDSRIQFVLNIARSERYLAEVQRRAGLTDSLDQLAEEIDSTRPGFSPVIRITATTGDPEKTFSPPPRPAGPGTRSATPAGRWAPRPPPSSTTRVPPTSTSAR